MKKHLKYLISLFLVLGLMVHDGTFVSQANADAYYQSSNVILRSTINIKDSELYFYVQRNSSKPTAFSIVLIFLNFREVRSFQSRIILKLQLLLHQRIYSFTNYSTFVNEIMTSKNQFNTLYLA